MWAWTVTIIDGKYGTYKDAESGVIINIIVDIYVVFLSVDDLKVRLATWRAVWTQCIYAKTFFVLRQRR